LATQLAEQESLIYQTVSVKSCFLCISSSICDFKSLNIWCYTQTKTKGLRMKMIILKMLGLHYELTAQQIKVLNKATAFEILCSNSK